MGSRLKPGGSEGHAPGPGAAVRPLETASSCVDTGDWPPSHPLAGLQAAPPPGGRFRVRAAAAAWSEPRREPVASSCGLWRRELSPTCRRPVGEHPHSGDGETSRSPCQPSEAGEINTEALSQQNRFSPRPPRSTCEGDAVRRREARPGAACGSLLTQLPLSGRFSLPARQGRAAGGKGRDASGLQGRRPGRAVPVENVIGTSVSSMQDKGPFLP